MKTISVVICTRDRPNHCKKCLDSVLKNKGEFEIIVVDQSRSDETKNIIEKFRVRKIHYQKSKTRGLSKARNIGANLSNSDYIAYTDDDCIVSTKWIENIKKLVNGEGSIFFGCVKSTKKPDTNLHNTIPNYSKLEGAGKKRVVIRTTKKNLIFVSGNNMIIKRSVFKNIGGFKEWLGSGSIGYGGEDLEFCYRAMENGAEINYSPSIVVYHDGWLTLQDHLRKVKLYLHSFQIVFFYYLFKGNMEFLDHLKSNTKTFLDEFNRTIINIRRGQRISSGWNVAITFAEFIFYSVRSFLIASFYSITN